MGVRVLGVAISNQQLIFGGYWLLWVYGKGGCRGGSRFRSDKVLVGSNLNKVDGWL